MDKGRKKKEKTKDVQLHISVNKEDKEQATKILEECGTTINSVVEMLLRYIINYRGIPFTVQLPPEDYDVSMEIPMDTSSKKNLWDSALQTFLQEKETFEDTEETMEKNLEIVGEILEQEHGVSEEILEEADNFDDDNSIDFDGFSDLFSDDTEELMDEHQENQKEDALEETLFNEVEEIEEDVVLTDTESSSDTEEEDSSSIDMIMPGENQEIEMLKKFLQTIG